MNNDDTVTLKRRPASDFNLKQWYINVGEAMSDRVTAKGLYKALWEKFASRYAPGLIFDEANWFELEDAVFPGNKEGWKRMKEATELIRANAAWVNEFLEVGDASFHWDKEVVYEGEEHA